MAVINPYRGLHQVMASMPWRWEAVTPHDTDYLELSGSDPRAAVALYTQDGGVIYYHNINDVSKNVELLGGAILPGLFLKVLATNTTATKIWAAFMDAG